MTYRNKPHFVIKKNLQKSKQTGKYFNDVVTPQVLADVCARITGCEKFTCMYADNDYEDEFLAAGYNKGRMAVMQYRDTAYFISFSERDIGGRNSSVQSVPTAFNLFYSNPYPQKKLYYYFLNTQGNAGTDYQILMYRLMKTVGFEFLNAGTALPIAAFASIEDIIHARKANAGKNRSNNSTYITKSSTNQYDIYGKTYGANKYETSMMCYALSLLAQAGQRVTLYEVLEGDLAELPAVQANQLHRGPGQGLVGGGHVRPFGGHDGLGQGRVPQNHVIDAGGTGLVQAKAGGGVALGIEITYQHLCPLGGERGGQIDAGCGFTYAPLLVDDGDGLSHVGSPSSRFFLTCKKHYILSGG